MTDATHPASQRRSLSPPAARRNKSAMSARGRESSLDRCESAGARASSPSETAAVAASDENTENTRLPTPRSPAVRDPQIPIVALEKQPQPPRGSSLGGFSAGPSACSTVRKRAGARNPSPEQALTEAWRPGSRAAASFPVEGTTLRRAAPAAWKPKLAYVSWRGRRGEGPLFS